MTHWSGVRGARALLLAGCAAIALSPVAARAEAAKPVYFSIPAQDLGASLNQFARQSEHQIVFSTEIAAGRPAPALQGELPPEQALAMLLAGTDLTWRRDGDAFMIVRASDPQSGSAAGAGAEGTVQALIVTAQKREENIQDVPIAMSAFTQEDLTRSQVAGGPDLMTQVPNFTFTKTNFSGYSIQIRGIGTQAISATVDPAVAVAFNNTPFIRNRFFEQEFYDLQRVEVLRGPQGTLYGRNATAGVVNIISAKPSFHYEAKLSGDVSNYNSTRLEGMLNIPLVEDKAALRIAGAWTKRDGYDVNQLTGNPIDGRDLWSTRVSLRIEPTDSIKANLIWEHFQENDDRLRSGKQLCNKDLPTEINGVTVPYDGGSAGSYQSTYSQGCKPASLYAPDSFQTPNGFALPYVAPLNAIGAPVYDNIDPYLSTTQSRNLRVIESMRDPQYKAKSDLGELQVSIDLGHALTLTSETGYNTDTIFSMEDYNRFNTTPGIFITGSNIRSGVIDDNGVFCDPQIGCSDRLVVLDVSTAKSRQFSEELRLSSNFDGPFNFSAGANFLRYDTEDKYYVFVNTLGEWAAQTNRAALMRPYVPGVSDNHECLPNGLVEGDPLAPQTIDPCIYMDPNPIGSLNDQGHNYFLSKNPYKLISYAAFGEAYYNITPTLKLTAGLRWTVDKKEAPRIPSWLIVTDNVGYPVMEVVRQTWSEPTGRLTLDWKPDLSFTDETLLYASYAHGYKAGGMNPPPAVIALYGTQFFSGLQESIVQPKTFDPEFVNAFEVGSKNTLADGKLTLNTTAFFYDYTGYQLSQIVNRSAVTQNFDAKVWGLEIEADWRPLENLRLGFKGGYENTRVADGMKAIDIMDRTAGDPNYVVERPFPTIPSNCILPTWFVTFDGVLRRPNAEGGNAGPCALAYLEHLDPVTFLPYVANPTVVGEGYQHLGPGDGPTYWENYPGFDPSTVPNNGEGIYKDLSGNSLPNAPHFTATLTADYTLPLPHEWLVTLHSDLYYQSEAWTRIFNMPGYDKLKAYNNINLAAIFSNEDAGWTVMAYIKNVLDKDNITGAFLNSDDTGLTTNVFLNEPRLYGLRVTKTWTGDGWWGSAGAGHTGPYPFRVEIAGQLQRHDAPYAPVKPDFIGSFSDAINPTSAQRQDLDWGNGGGVKLTYTPSGSAWSLSAAYRSARTNGTNKFRASEASRTVCLFGPPFEYVCDSGYRNGIYLVHPTDWSDATVANREDHRIVDFNIGHDVGLGTLEGLRSHFEGGLRYAHLGSQTHLRMTGVPDWTLPDEWAAAKYAQHHFYDADLLADRKFEGLGPVLAWDGAQRLLGAEAAGRVDVDWSVKGGVLFGRQNTKTVGRQTASYYNDKYTNKPPHMTGDPVVTPGPVARSTSVSVPVLDLSLGLSYEVQGMKVGAGYRWERYYNAIDGGYAEHKSFDRTIDGPYFKVSVGFGG